ncbi:hypothetical protein IFM89_033729 [Coptis chinensis]|uniref:Uncharacterized protein n=1 Tax=Coptis chinensis TaxID=261450 RepID=A0A835GZ83_9MAGN|nr:hypothetical protein IFM89_033729 [Coptis chinensis]
MEENVTQRTGEKRKGRGAVVCSRLTKMKENEHVDVVFNQNGQRIGEGGKDLASYSGLLPASRVSIATYDNWHDVKGEARDILRKFIKADPSACRLLAEPPVLIDIDRGRGYTYTGYVGKMAPEFKRERMFSSSRPCSLSLMIEMIFLVIGKNVLTTLVDHRIPGSCFYSREGQLMLINLYSSIPSGDPRKTKAILLST